MNNDAHNAIRAAYAAGFLRALEVVAAETGDRNTRAICQRLRGKAERIQSEAEAALPVAGGAQLRGALAREGVR